MNESCHKHEYYWLATISATVSVGTLPKLYEKGSFPENARWWEWGVENEGTRGKMPEIGSDEENEVTIEGVRDDDSDVVVLGGANYLYASKITRQRGFF